MNKFDAKIVVALQNPTILDILWK